MRKLAIARNYTCGSVVVELSLLDSTTMQKKNNSRRQMTKNITNFHSLLIQFTNAQCNIFERRGSPRKYACSDRDKSAFIGTLNVHFCLVREYRGNRITYFARSGQSGYRYTVLLRLKISSYFLFFYTIKYIMIRYKSFLSFLFLLQHLFYDITLSYIINIITLHFLCLFLSFFLHINFPNHLIFLAFVHFFYFDVK